jgi:hypothetical protein
MANHQIQISIIDAGWPKLKLIVNRNNIAVREMTASYDIALNQFTPAVTDALRLAIEAVVKEHKH